VVVSLAHRRGAGVEWAEGSEVLLRSHRRSIVLVQLDEVSGAPQIRGALARPAALLGTCLGLASFWDSEANLLGDPAAANSPNPPNPPNYASPCFTPSLPRFDSGQLPQGSRDPIDDPQSPQRCALHSFAPEPKGLELQLANHVFCCSTTALALRWPPSPLLPPLPPLVLDVRLHKPNSHVAPYPSGQSCTTFFSCAAASWLLNLNSWN
jgi:hypothetical protein